MEGELLSKKTWEKLEELSFTLGMDVNKVVDRAVSTYLIKTKLDAVRNIEEANKALEKIEINEKILAKKAKEVKEFLKAKSLEEAYKIAVKRFKEGDKTFGSLIFEKEEELEKAFLTAIKIRELQKMKKEALLFIFSEKLFNNGEKNEEKKVWRDKNKSRFKPIKNIRKERGDANTSDRNDEGDVEIHKKEEVAHEVAEDEVYDDDPWLKL